MKISNCNDHPDANDPALSCWALRHDDGRLVAPEEALAAIETGCADTTRDWPIARLTVDGSEQVLRVDLYSPGLPPGEHDVWRVPVDNAAERDRLRMAEAAAMALVMSHEVHIERLRVALGACDAALSQCQPCADPECGATQRDYIDTARAAAARLLGPNVKFSGTPAET